MQADLVLLLEHHWHESTKAAFPWGPIAHTREFSCCPGAGLALQAERSLGGVLTFSVFFLLKIRAIQAHTALLQKTQSVLTPMA